MFISYVHEYTLKKYGRMQVVQWLLPCFYMAVSPCPEGTSDSADTDSKIKAGDKTKDGRTFSDHAADQANERGFTEKNVDDIVNNNKKNRTKEITDEGEVRWRYQDKRGNTVITNENSDRIITVYSYPKSTNDGNYIPKGGK